LNLFVCLSSRSIGSSFLFWRQCVFPEPFLNIYFFLVVRVLLPIVPFPQGLKKASWQLRFLLELFECLLFATTPPPAPIFSADAFALTEDPFLLESPLFLGPFFLLPPHQCLSNTESRAFRASAAGVISFNFRCYCPGCYPPHFIVSGFVTLKENLRW